MIKDLIKNKLYFIFQIVNDIFYLVFLWLSRLFWAIRNPLKFIKKHIWKKCPNYQQVIWALKNPRKFFKKYKNKKLGNFLHALTLLFVTENDFSKLCRELLPYLSSFFPKINKNSNKKSVLVETRTLDHTEFVIKNTIQKLGNDWGHIIFCSKENIDQITTICTSISDEIEIILLPCNIQSRDDYNNFCLNDFFWESLKCEKILIYQTDTILIKEFDPVFLEYDYIGGYWGQKHTEHIEKVLKISDLYCGNGGLSLRTVSLMRYFLKKYSVPKNSKELDIGLTYLPEDIFFAQHVRDENKKFPSLQVAWEFSSELEYNPTSFGLHQPWRLFSSSDEMKKVIKKNFFQKNKKRILFINHEEGLTGARELLKSLIIEEQQRQEYDVWVLSLRIDNNPWELTNLIRYQDVPGFSDQEKVSYITEILNPDVVYANSIVSLSVARYFECKKIISIHEYRSLIPYGVYKELSDLNNFDKIIVACEPAKKLLENFNIQSEVIPYYININLEQVQKRHTQEYIIGAGYVQLRKGVPRFIEIAKMLPHKKFVWIGSTEGVVFQGNKIIMHGHSAQLTDYQLGDPIEDVTIESIIPENVKFIGLKNHNEVINEWLPRAECFLMLSTDDPFPLVVIESKLLNKNVVTLKESGDLYKVCDQDDLILDVYNKEKIVHYIKNLQPNSYSPNYALIEKMKNNFEINRKSYVDLLNHRFQSN